jgi:hypothetical protein
MPATVTSTTALEARLAAIAAAGETITYGDLARGSWA